MARVLVGDTSVPLGTYELVAELLELSLTFNPWKQATGQSPASVGAVPTVVDRSLGRIKIGAVAALGGILKPPPGVGPVSIDDMRV